MTTRLTPGLDLAMRRVMMILAVLTAAMSATTCVSDPDCGICDPEALVLESIVGLNYAGQLVKLLGPECEGEACPKAIRSGKYFVETVIPCVETEAARTAPRGPEEWCKLSPLVVDTGLQFIFNNLLDPTSIELVRKQPGDPRQLEVYDWKSQIVHLEGPLTRFNGDYLPGYMDRPHRVTRSINLACIDNLARLGKAFDHTVLAADPDICDGAYLAEDGKTWPLKTELLRGDPAGPVKLEARRGELETSSRAQSCSPPQHGPDSCCDACDYELSVNVSKYGLLAAVDEHTWPGEQRRSESTAIPCDPMGDKFKDCADFVPHVYRAHEVRSFEYDWNGSRGRFHVALADKLRETHPNARPAGLEQATVPCWDDDTCVREQLEGAECVGTDADGKACHEGDDCVDRRCLAEWFGECRVHAATTGPGGHCVDRRYDEYGAAACYTASAPFFVCEDSYTCEGEDFSDGARTQRAGSRLSLADENADGLLAAIEGCRTTLGGVDKAPCDPLFQSGVSPIPRHDRNEALPSTTRECVCEDSPAAGCKDLVDALCRVGGDADQPIVAEKQGQYALKFVREPGGVIYDPALKGVLFLPADLGNVPRSLVESCARDRNQRIGPLNIKDGWRAHDDGGETFENFDRAMCSSAEYRVVFTTPPGPGEPAREHLRDKLGNTLAGKASYVLRTPDFHVVPGSGFPADNLRVGPCDDFSLRFTNKYDLAPANLEKLQIVRISADGMQELEVVAGGVDCAHERDVGVPCLTIDVRDQKLGVVRVSIDDRIFGADVLVAGRRYRLKVPGLTLAPGETVHDVLAGDPARVRAAFWDACGMPLVTSMPDPAALPDYFYDFDIDPSIPRDDRDQDNVPLSCDNAPKDWNPDQSDMDGEGFADVVDACPTVPRDNDSDSDRDGIGNSCDRCGRTLTAYKKFAEAAGVPVPMQIRNIPVQDDLDQDGIGDVCDNCIVRANCGDFGPAAEGLEPAGISTIVPADKSNICQVDDDEFKFIGDACIVEGAPIQLADAVGPVGLGDADDFDQDGLANAADGCPRVRASRIDCVSAADCPEGAPCTGGRCNHVDTDKDGVGDRCDTCPFDKNPMQVQDGGMQQDDPDGDFVGNACEADSACRAIATPRRIGFYSEISNGECCVTTFDPARGFMDPGHVEVDANTGTCTVIDPSLPLAADCSDAQDQVSCRKLPAAVITRPGVVSLPPGCTQAGVVLTLKSPEIAGDEQKLYEFMCRMPVRDQDFDGVGDFCDLCPWAFDPDNSLYRDANNKLWPNLGKFCHGVYEADTNLRSCEEASDSDAASSSSGD